MKEDRRDGSRSLVLTYEMLGVLYGIAFSGKAARPVWNYRFRNEDQRNASIARFWEGETMAKEAKAKYAASRKDRALPNTMAIYEFARNHQGDGNGAWLEPKNIATLLRERLPMVFPGVRFSVTTSTYSGGDSVSVEWTGGPTRDEVEKVAGNYSFSGFDGMIDMKFSKSRWLAPDGSMSLAYSTGTGDSMGSCPEVMGDPHNPGAVLVKGGTDRVFCRRND